MAIVTLSFFAFIYEEIPTGGNSVVNNQAVSMSYLHGGCNSQCNSRDS